MADVTVEGHWERPDYPAGGESVQIDAEFAVASGDLIGEQVLTTNATAVLTMPSSKTFLSVDFS